jgi:hypothetical protein
MRLRLFFSDLFTKRNSIAHISHVIILAGAYAYGIILFSEDKNKYKYPPLFLSVALESIGKG